MTKRNKIIAGVVALVTLGGMISCAHHARHGHHGEKAKKVIAHRVDSLLDDMNANEKQRQEVLRLQAGLFAEFEKAHAGSKDVKKVFLDEWKAAKPDAARLHALADERVAAYQKAIHQTIDSMVVAHQTFDQKQRDVVTRKIEKRLAD